jgi:hypothetical protein
VPFFSSLAMRFTRRRRDDPVARWWRVRVVGGVFASSSTAVCINRVDRDQTNPRTTDLARHRLRRELRVARERGERAREAAPRLGGRDMHEEVLARVLLLRPAAVRRAAVCVSGGGRYR